MLASEDLERVFARPAVAFTSGRSGATGIPFWKKLIERAVLRILRAPGVVSEHSV